tara:strand:+ start:5721 stop:6404 length:684 start_codon:yes stop_codon:yes gene_type:complete
MITESLTYAVPDVAFVAGISGSVTQDFPYNGPESFYVEIDDEGEIVNIDVPSTHKNAIEVTWADNPEICALVGHYFVEDWNVTPTFVSADLDDGFTLPSGTPTTYQKRTNYELGDLFEAKYDRAAGTWSMEQIVKLKGSPLIEEAKRRKRYVKQYTDMFDFAGDTGTAITAFQTAIDNYLAAAVSVPVWNYLPEHFAPYFADIPKVPALAAAAFKELPADESLEALS